MARSTQLAYPVRLETDDRGAVLVSFLDIPEALTEGATEQEALAEAQGLPHRRSRRLHR